MTKYARIRGRVFGPFDETQILGMIRQGKIGRHTEISDDGKTWIKAGETSLFTVAPRKTSVNHTMQTENESLGNEGLSLSGDESLTRSGAGTAEWFLSNDGITGTGPYSIEDVLSMLSSQKVNENTLAWKQGGMAKPLRQIPEISNNMAAPEPIPVQGESRSPSENTVNPVEQISCPFCGKSVTGGSLFCPHCGKTQPKVQQTPRHAVKRCLECDTPLEPSATICPRCGTEVPVQTGASRSTTVYMLLAIFLGIFGTHNFYAGYKTNAILQLLFTISLWGIIVSFIWGLKDAFTIKEDGEGFPFV